METFDEADVEEMIQSLAGTEPPAPSTSTSQARRTSGRKRFTAQAALAQILNDNDPSPWAPIPRPAATTRTTPSKANKVPRGIQGELQFHLAFLNSTLGADTKPIENLVASMREGISTNIGGSTPRPTGRGGLNSNKKKEKEKREFYEDPIEKRMRLREYKVTTANPKPWIRDFGVPNFKATVLTVVASVSLAVNLDLKRIAERARNVEYNPKRFASLIMRVREPKSAALIFASGKMVVAGTKTEEECKRAVRKYARVIQKIGYRVSIVSFEIQNISANAHLRFGVRVHDMAQDEKISRFVSYEAEIFPGLVYSLVKPKVKAIIFVTGAILMTGAKSEAEIQEALETIYPITRKHRR